MWAPGEAGRVGAPSDQPETGQAPRPSPAVAIAPSSGRFLPLVVASSAFPAGSTL